MAICWTVMKNYTFWVIPTCLSTFLYRTENTLVTNIVCWMIWTHARSNFIVLNCRISTFWIYLYWRIWITFAWCQSILNKYFVPSNRTCFIISCKWCKYKLNIWPYFSSICNLIIYCIKIDIILSWKAIVLEDIKVWRIWECPLNFIIYSYFYLEIYYFFRIFERKWVTCIMVWRCRSWKWVYNIISLIKFWRINRTSCINYFILGYQTF